MNKPTSSKVRGGVQAPRIDAGETSAFLDFLGDGLGSYAFQTYDDDKGRNDKERGRTYIGTFEDRRRELVTENRARFAVHVTINDTAGKSRRAANVVSVRKQFVEIDGAHSLDEIHEIARTSFLDIAWINESSPGKYHVYFNIAGDVAADLQGFKKRQKQLAALFDGGVESVDLPRVLRLPGFYHHKGDPFMVRAVYKDPTARAHTIHDFDMALPSIDDTVTDTGSDTECDEDETAINRAIEHFKMFPPAISNTPSGKMGKKGNNQTFDACCYARDFGVEQSTCLDLALEHYNPRCEPEWSFEELERLVANAYKYAQGKQGAKHPMAQMEKDFGADPIPADFEQSDQTAQDDGSKTPYLHFVKASDIKMRIIDWLWFGHLALGQHSLFAGVQGDGKSQIIYSIIAAITTGGPWPGSNECAPIGNCIVLSAEDTGEDVLVPRLKAAGADLTRVMILEASVDEHGRRNKVLLQRDMKMLETAVKKMGDVKMISIDPISSYLGGDLDSHHNTELRDALDPIGTMAHATGAAVASITHFNKASKGVTAMNRIMGGVAFVAAPRAAFVILRDDEIEGRRLMLPVKLNLAKSDDAYGMAYEIEEVDTGVMDDRFDPPVKIFAPRVKWLERVGKSADDVLAARERSAGTSPLQDAMMWLVERLAFAPELQTVIEEEVTGANLHSWATMRRAAKKLGVISRKRSQRDGRGPYEWMLPEVAVDVAGDPDLSAMAPASYQGAAAPSEELQ
jgi:putative DNA primase/helicase